MWMLRHLDRTSSSEYLPNIYGEEEEKADGEKEDKNM